MWNIRHHLLLVQPHLTPVEASEWFSRSVSYGAFCSNPNERSQEHEWLWAEPRTFIWELGWMKCKCVTQIDLTLSISWKLICKQKRFLNFAEPHQWTAYNLRTKCTSKAVGESSDLYQTCHKTAVFSQGRKRNLFSTGKSIIFTGCNEIHLTLLKYKLKLNQI